ncbi:MAG: zinc-finger domain-containing protein [gamma proteobacterium symbiont of Taylorina sp.]|nr:zinc-finger domain-containing protein [gamma proteobacterium symbiont of Taylorina sp.]
MQKENTEELLTPNTGNHYELKESELPAHCPMPGMSQWNSHPKVYLPIKENGGTTTCPYCSAIYSLKE